MTRRLALGALLVTVVLVGAYLSAARRVEGPPLDPRSTSAEGARGLVELLDRYGSVEVLDSVPTGEHATAVVLQDRFDRDAEAGLRHWVEDGGTLLVADRSSTLLPAVIGEVSGTIDVRCDIEGLEGVARLDLGDGAALDPAGASGACTGPDGAPVVAEETLGDGRIVALGGPAPLTNARLDEADNAVLAVGVLVSEPGARVAFLRPRPAVGAGERSLVDLVGTPVRAALAQLLVAFGVVALWRARRLGRPVEEPQQVLVESAELTDAVGRLLARSRRPERAAAVLRDRARRDLSGPLGLPLDAPATLVVDTIATRTTLDPAEARRATLDPVSGDAELVEVATLLARIREEITHASTRRDPDAGTGAVGDARRPARP